MTIRKTRPALLAGFAACVVAAAAAPQVHAAIGKIKLRHHYVGNDKTNRPELPIIQVRQVDGHWRATSDMVHFRLRVYARLNVGSEVWRIDVGVPDTSTRSATGWSAGQGESGRKKNVRAHVAFRGHTLGKLARLAERECATLRPAATKEFVRPAVIEVRIHGKRGTLKIEKSHFTRKGKIDIKIRCQVKLRSRTAQYKLPLKVKGAGIQVQKFGKRCPLTVFLKVRVYTNKQTSLTYVVRSSRGRSGKKTVQIRAKNSRGSYEGGYDHRLTIKKSVKEKFWVVIKGRKVGRPASLSVRCFRGGGPKGLSN